MTTVCHYLKDDSTGEYYPNPEWSYLKGKLHYIRARNRYPQYYRYTYERYREMYEPGCGVLDSMGINVYEEV